MESFRSELRDRKTVEQVVGHELVGGTLRCTFELNGKRYRSWGIDAETGKVECEVLD